MPEGFIIMGWLICEFCAIMAGGLFAWVMRGVAIIAGRLMGVAWGMLGVA